ncbi:3815_t:CDS:2, partial [Racocetra persica]
MVTATERLTRNPSYKNDFYINGGKLFSLEKPQKVSSQLAITSFSKSYDEREQFVLG